MELSRAFSILTRPVDADELGENDEDYHSQRPLIAVVVRRKEAARSGDRRALL